MRVLIVKLGAIGDVLRTTALLPGLKDKYRAASIDWLAASSGKEVLLQNKFIHQIFLWEEREHLEAYDLVVALEDDPEVCRFATEIAAQQLVGAFVKEGKITYTPSAWFDMSALSRFGLTVANDLKRKNRKTYQQHMAELLGVEIGPYVFNLTADEKAYGEDVVRNLGIEKGEKIIGVNTGAGKRWQYKSLSIEKTIDLVGRIRDDLGAVALILGGEEEKERNAIIAEETGMPAARVQTLRGFAAVINQCDKVVSSDSLAMHFAIALAKRLVVFFGPTSPTEIELYGLGYKVFPKMDCLVCYKKVCDRQPSCMDLLSIDELFEALKRV